jgi:predicted aconitase
MQLTSHEQDILNGKYGEGMAMAMEIQMAIGETFDADRMVPINPRACRAQRACRRRVVCRGLLEKGARCIVFATVKPEHRLSPT